MKRRAGVPNKKLLKKLIVNGRPQGWRAKDQKSGTFKKSKKNI